MGKFEYRVCWSASSNVSFDGETEWYKWDGAEDTVEEIEAALETTPVPGSRFSQVVGMALEESGFECWAEIRPGVTE